MIEEQTKGPGLTGKVCVVTGAASGIGRGIALRLARAGAKVALLDRNAPGAAETLAMITAQGGQGLAVECDAGDAASIRAACATVTKGLGETEVLVNNAGILKPGTLATLDPADWAQVMQVNLTGYFLCAQIFGQAMLASGRGALVHVGSITAQQTMQGIGAYGVAKAGVTMLSRSLALEWGPQGVRSNVILPGFIQTEIARAQYENPAILSARQGATPLRRIGQPQDVAEAALFLASDASAFINGTELLVDGGLSLGLMTSIKTLSGV